MATDTTVETPQGILVHGEYVGQRKAKAFTDRNGKERQPIELGVRFEVGSGSDELAIRYDDGDAAGAAWEAAGGPQVGESIVLPVFVRLFKDHSRQLAFVTYEGVRSTGGGGGWA